MDWANRQVTILGFARQGMALARYLVARGAQVTLSDMKPAQTLTAELSAMADLPIHYVLGEHPSSLLDHCDVLCLSGGVPIDLADRSGSAAPQRSPQQRLTDLFRCVPCADHRHHRLGRQDDHDNAGGRDSETEYRRLDTDQSDTVSGVKVWVGGNIGNPLIADVGSIKAEDQVVMELSSFQLELMTHSPHIACITNITPNHLDRHGTMDAYTRAKSHILDFQSESDWAVLNADNNVTAQLQTQARKVWFSMYRQAEGDGAWLDENMGLRIRIAATGYGRCDLQLDTTCCSWATTTWEMR